MPLIDLIENPQIGVMNYTRTGIAATLTKHRLPNSGSEYIAAVLWFVTLVSLQVSMGYRDVNVFWTLGISIRADDATTQTVLEFGEQHTDALQVETETIAESGKHVDLD